MRYMLMSNVDWTLVQGLSPEANTSLMEEFVTFTTALAESGVLRGTEHLHAAETATTVRVRDGHTVLTDGPFADVTEVFGGYWIVEAPDLDTVLATAAACPASRVGSVEVRSLNELG